MVLFFYSSVGTKSQSLTKSVATISYCLFSIMKLLLILSSHQNSATLQEFNLQAINSRGFSLVGNHDPWSIFSFEQIIIWTTESANQACSLGTWMDPRYRRRSEIIINVVVDGDILRRPHHPGVLLLHQLAEELLDGLVILLLRRWQPIWLGQWSYYLRTPWPWILLLHGHGLKAPPPAIPMRWNGLIYFSDGFALR